MDRRPRAASVASASVSKEEQRIIYGSEENRIESFQNWPNWAKVAPDDLAKAGFFYIEKLDRVRCFACSVEIERWDKNEDPKTAHLKFSPDCPFFRSRKTSVTTVPTLHQIGGQVLNGLGATAETSGVAERQNGTSSSQIHSSSQPHYTGMTRTFSQESATEPSKKRGSLEKMRQHKSAEDPLLSHPVQATSGPEGEASSSSRRAVQASHMFSLVEFPSLERQCSREVEEVREKVLTEAPYKELTEYCQRDDLLELLCEATNPFYAHINNRITTYSSWTRQNTVQARALAEAGFFYIGDSDKVRCFMCGGTVCNWDKGDIPLYEHSRWYGDCPYLLRCMKNPVVKATVETARIATQSPAEAFKNHHHHHGTGRTQCDLGMVKAHSNAVSIVT